MKINKKVSNFGFTLVELAIVLTITSLLLGSYFAVYERSTTVNFDRSLNKQLDKIEESILSFYHSNGFLPCPASLEATGASLGTSTNCSTTAVAGVTDTGSGAEIVRIGALPTQSLNLSPRYLSDPWGNKIEYAVVRNLATNTNTFNHYQSSNRVITIVDDNAQTLNNNGIGAFVILSHGANSNGAYSMNGQNAIPCDLFASDTENCNNNSIFRDQFQNLTKGSSLYFDDTLRWKTYAQVKQLGDFQSNALGFAHKIGIWSDERTGNSNQRTTNGCTFCPSWESVSFPDEIFNSTSGASVSGNVISLDQGTYIIRASVVSCETDSFSAGLYDGNSESSTLLAAGSSQHATRNYDICRISVITTKQTIGPGGNNVYIGVRMQRGNPTDGLGRSINNGIPYSYRILEIQQLD